VPELPEVETVRRQLAERLPGHTITAVEILDERITAPVAPEELAARLVGERIAAVTRRGKYLVLELDSSEAVALHLRMTGRLHWRPEPIEDGTDFLRMWLAFDDDSSLAFGDMRRFGRVWMLPSDARERELYWAEKLGPEPLDDRFTARRLAGRLARRRGPIKAVLLNQAVVAGLGNMYVDEALFQARIHPERPADELEPGEVGALHRAIRDRLRVAVASGGASIDSYRDGLGEKGSMQDLLRVHLHEGDPCPRCGTTIVKTRVAQRGTYLCPSCQAAPC
jgi:formamidopyrimidine-DNA glycosylase